VSALQRLAQHLERVRRRRAKRSFLAFLVIVVYGGIVANVAQTAEVERAKHPTFAVWLWPILLGFVAFALVAVLLRDDE
jgi:glucan phosphoethanolaminetransferase (alkaline phosphatase superfamily)